MFEVKDVEKVERVEKDLVAAYPNGALCILEDDVEKVVPETNTRMVLKKGSPVKIVRHVTDSLKFEGSEIEVKRSVITIEDYRGEKWDIERLDTSIEDFDDLYDDCDDIPLSVLKNSDVEWLLSDKALEHYKKAERTDNGIRTKYSGPFKILCGCLLFSLALELSEGGPWEYVYFGSGALVFCWGLYEFLTGYHASRKPLSRGEMAFFKNREKTMNELKVLGQLV